MSFTLNSGIVIFDVIEILWDSPKTREIFCQKLKEKNLPSDIETVSKYIRTLRKLGFKVVYKNDAYQLIDTPFKNKTRHNSDGLEITFSLLRELFAGKTTLREKDLEEKLLNILNPNKNIQIKNRAELIFKNNDRISKNLLILNKAIIKNDALKFTYQKEEFLTIPKELIYKKNGIFLVAYSKKEELTKVFRLDKIKKLKVENNESANFYEIKNETIFKITGRLIKNYILREREIAHYKDGYVLVTNYTEEKEQLFSRILRYGKYCEVVYPESDKEFFKEKVKDLIKYYEKL